MASVADPYGHNHGFLDQSHYFFFQLLVILTRLSGPRNGKTLLKINLKEICEGVDLICLA
jgi:hypothetical protein